MLHFSPTIFGLQFQIAIFVLVPCAHPVQSCTHSLSEICSKWTACSLLTIFVNFCNYQCKKYYCFFLEMLIYKLERISDCTTLSIQCLLAVGCIRYSRTASTYYAIRGWWLPQKYMDFPVSANFFCILTQPVFKHWFCNCRFLYFSFCQWRTVHCSTIQ